MYTNKKTIIQLTIIILLSIIITTPVYSANQTTQNILANTERMLNKANSLFTARNYNDAFKKYKKILITNKIYNTTAFNNAVLSLQRLNKQNQTDEFITKVLKIHNDKWQCYNDAALLYDHTLIHSGHIQGNKFIRGYSRNYNTAINTSTHDHLHALLYMHKAKELITTSNADNTEKSNFFFTLANMYIKDIYPETAIRLLIKSDIDKIPPYSEKLIYTDLRGNGAPVNKDNTPYFFSLPGNERSATNDGELFRYYLHISNQYSTDKARESLTLAKFAQKIYGIETLSNYYYNVSSEKPYILKLSELTDNQTIAKLESGIQAFTLPAPYNYLEKFIAQSKKRPVPALLILIAREYENRRQYSNAAKYWSKIIESPNAALHQKNEASNHLQQITDSFITFESTPTQSVINPELWVRFRNTDKVTITVWSVNTKRLINFITTTLKSNASSKNSTQYILQDLGWKLTDNKLKEYLGSIKYKKTIDLTNYQSAITHGESRAKINLPAKFTGGAYFIEATLPNSYQANILLWLSDITITSKALTSGERLFFTSNSDTGKSLAKSKLNIFGYLPNNSKHLKNTSKKYIETTLTTDNNGITILPKNQVNPDYNYLVSSCSEDECKAYLGFEQLFNYNNKIKLSPKRILYITSKPLYQAGEEVLISGWVRNYDYTNNINYPKKQLNQFELFIYNPKGEKVESKLVNVDKNGNFKFKFKTNSNSQLGIWSISSNLNIAQNGNFFRIEKYIKPEFTAAITLNNPKATLSDVLTFTINAKYNFGGPLQNAQIKYKIYRKPQVEVYRPNQKWDWLYDKNFDNHTNEIVQNFDYIKMQPAYTEPTLIEENTAYTDNNGIAHITVKPLAYGKIDKLKSYTFNIKAQIIANNKRSITEEAQVTLSNSEFSLAITADQNYYNIGETIGLMVTPFSNNKKLKKTIEGNLTIKLYKYDHKMNKVLLKRFPNIKQNSDYSYKHHLNILENGYYSIECETKDSFNNSITSKKKLYIYSPSENHDLNLPVESDLIILPKKKYYAENDTAELLIITKEQLTTLLVFTGINSEKYPIPDIIQTRNNANIIKYTIKHTDAPNTFIEVLTTPKRHNCTATAELLIPPVNKIITLTITPDKNIYSPAEKAKLLLTATDSTGKPVSGNSIVTVYDNALDQSTNNGHYPDIYKYFWGFTNYYYPQTLTSIDKFSYNMYNKETIPMQPIGIFGSFFDTPETNFPTPRLTGNKIMFKAEGALKTNLAVADSATPNDAITRSKDSNISQEVRKDFSTGAIFTNNIYFDKSGKATIEVPLADSLTTWKIRAWIMTSKTEVGQADSTLITSKNLLIIPSLPRYLIEGDTARINATIYNNSKSKKEIKLSLNTSNELSVKTPSTSKIEIPANSAIVQYWKLLANKKSKPNITITANSNSSKDTVILPITILTKGQKLFDSKTILLSNNNTFNSKFIIPDKIKEKSQTLSIIVSPDLTSLLINVSKTITRDDIKTNDTLLANLLPEIIINKLISKDTDIESKYTKNAISNKLTKRLAILEKMQNSDGGWSWIGKNNFSSTYITALILKSLELVDQSGFNIPAQLITSARLYLINHEDEQVKRLINYKIQTPNSKQYASNLDALIYETLSQSNNENIHMKEFLYRDKSHLSVYSLCLFATGLFKNADNKMLPEILKNIEQYLTIDPENNTAYLETSNNNFWWHWYNSESETIAKYLTLRLLTEEQNATNNKLAHYLINNFKHISMRNSIHCINEIMNALKVYIQKNTLTPNLSKVCITLNNQNTITLSPKELSTHTTQFMANFLPDQLRTGTNKLTISKTNKQDLSPIYFSYTISYFSLDDTIHAHGIELKTRRKYYKLIPSKKIYALPNGKGGTNQILDYSYIRKELKGGEQINSGDLIEVELIVTSKNDYEYIYIKDNKPACLEPVENKSGYSYNSINYYTEYRDTSVDYYIESMPRGTYSFTYRAYALFSGAFTAPAAISKGAFANELNSNSTGFKFKISN